LSEKPSEKSGTDKFVDSTIKVLDSTIHEKSGLLVEKTICGIE